MDLIQFVVERYNYWIFIVLMMTGLYTVIARGNLVKTIIGLNIFQTSVFIYYISIGKIYGGTAPIYVPGDMERRTDHGDGHGSGHGSGHGGGHGADHGAGHGAEKGVGGVQDSLHGGDHGGGNEGLLSGAAADDHGAGAALDHGDAPSNDHFAEPALTVADDHASDDHVSDGHASDGHGGDGHGGDAYAGDAYGGADLVGDVIYSNPLPHVLILTAIVVGVATTAVGLALAVRIREAYGTIEEDELEAADNIAEFGVADPRAAIDEASR